jgi:hypothetical protein
MRASIAFLISPLLAAAVGAFFLGAKSLSVSNAAYAFVLLGLAGYVAALVFGWWLYLLCKLRAWLSATSLATVGAVSALLAALLLSFIVPSRVGWFQAFLNLASIGTPLGALAGLAFWRLSFRRSSAHSNHSA